MIDLSLRALFRDGARYRVTGQYDGIDLLNGGKHRATDVGNFGMDDPILSPITGWAVGLRHWDSALGVRYALGNDWLLELWHLNATLAPLSKWVQVTKGQVCGRTGNTGAKLPDGSPMPAHTHIVLKRHGIPYDVERYLLGVPFPTEEDVIVTGTWRPRTEVWHTVVGEPFSVGGVTKQWSDKPIRVTTFLEELIDGETPAHRRLLALYPDPIKGPEVLVIPRTSLTNPSGGVAGLPHVNDPRMGRARTAAATNLETAKAVVEALK